MTNRNESLRQSTVAAKQWALWRKEARQAEKKPSKYRNKITVVNGIKFASKREAEFYQKLRLLKAAGKVKDFILQPKFKFPMGFSYVGDFHVSWADGKQEVIDVKGVETAVFKLKAKCMTYFYPDVVLRIIR